MNNMKKLSIFILTVLLFNNVYAQETENLENKFLKNTRQLIYEGSRSGEGYFSDEGRYLIFQSEREEANPFYQIYILDFETGDINRVSPGTGKTTCSFFEWSGDHVMFSSSHLDPEAVNKQKMELDFRASGEKKRYSWDYETTMDIFTANRDGSDIKRLTDEVGYDAEGSYSPDGKLIVYSTNKDVYNRELSKEEKEKLDVDASFFCDLYIMNADGSDKSRLTNSPGYDGGPFFSPDGKRIIWRRFTPDGHAADVFTMNIDGTDEKRITDFDCLSWAPYYHPSGDYIVWAANKMGYSNFEIYLTDVNGLKEPIRVTYTEGFDGLPVFSPDGKKVVWTSSRTDNGKAQLFIAGWDDAFAREQLEKAPLRKLSQGNLNFHFKPAIDAAELSEKLSYLASDELDGRMTGSTGIALAADYISGIFSDLGLESFGNNSDYFQAFDFVSEIKVNKKENSFLSGDKKFELNKDFVPLNSTENGTLNAAVVFGGYGIKVNDGAGFDYDSYSSLDVKDKIVMVLDGYPLQVDESKKKTLSGI